MVHGKKGMYLEAWKFGVYISIPVIASIHYSNPDNQKYWADYWQFIKYPENPNINVKQQIEKLVNEKELQRDQRAAYQEQLESLQQAAERSANYESGELDKVESTSPSWWRGLVSGSKSE